MRKLKNAGLLTIFFMINVVFSFAQDVITTIDGKELICKVLEIDEPKIKYRLADELDGPIRNLNLSKVFMIKYENGKKEIIAKLGNKAKKNNAYSKKYKPFSAGITTSLIMDAPWFMPGGKLSVGYEFKVINLRFQLNGLWGIPVFSDDISYNQKPYDYIFAGGFNIQYLIKLRAGDVELFPELGVGFSIANRQTKNLRQVLSPLINLGMGMDIRLTDILSVVANPRYQIQSISSSRNTGLIIKGLFSLNIGIRVRFGK